MKINPEEISAIIKQQIESFHRHLEVSDTGVVLQTNDGIAHIHGLHNAMASELLEFESGVYGLVLNLEEDSVGCAIMGPVDSVREGDTVKRTGRVIQVPVGDGLIGRVVNPLGQPLDGKGPVHSEKTRPIEVIAPGVMSRQPVNTPLQTGIKAIDSMTPIGRGQRELIIGDRGTGKTAVVVDTILNQKGQDVICIYVAIGQKSSTVARVINTLEEHGAMEYSIVVAANASETPPIQYIAPYAGCAMGEEFMWQGKDVLVIYDDLSKHAVSYRAMSLLLRRPPGREAYPGDVFYLHSRLLERAARLHDDLGGGSLTALPIIETQAGDVSAYIPTNVISITDGQIYLESDLFFAGVRPAVNVGLSVSRVGGAAQVNSMRRTSGSLRLDLAQYRELQAFAQFGADLDESSRARLTRGERLTELLKQPEYDPLPVGEQVVQIYAGTNGYFDKLPVEDVQSTAYRLSDYVRQMNPDLMKTLRTEKRFSKETEAVLRSEIEAFFKQTPQ